MRMETGRHWLPIIPGTWRGMVCPFPRPASPLDPYWACGHPSSRRRPGMATQSLLAGTMATWKQNCMHIWGEEVCDGRRDLKRRKERQFCRKKLIFLRLVSTKNFISLDISCLPFWPFLSIVLPVPFHSFNILSVAEPSEVCFISFHVWCLFHVCLYLSHCVHMIRQSAAGQMTQDMVWNKATPTN